MATVPTFPSPSGWALTQAELNQGFFPVDTSAGLQDTPAVADNLGATFGIAYRAADPAGTLHIRGQFYDTIGMPDPSSPAFPDGTVIPNAPPVVLDDGNGTILSGPAMVGWGDGYNVVWQERASDTAPTLLKAQLTGPNALVGGETVVDDGAGRDVTAQSGAVMAAYTKATGPAKTDVATGFDLAWVETRSTDTAQHVMLQRFEVAFDADGNPTGASPAGIDGEQGVGDNLAIELGQGRDVSLAVLHDGQTLATWIDEAGHLRGAGFDQDGNDLAATFDLDAALGGVAAMTARVVGVGAGGFGVVWVTSDNVLHGQTFVPGANPGEFDPNPNSPTPITIGPLTGFQPGTLNIAGLGEGDPGSVVSFGTTSGSVVTLHLDADGAQVGDAFTAAQGAVGPSALAGLIGERVVSAWQIGGADGDVVARFLDTRPPGADLVGDVPLPDGGFRAVRDVLVGTIGNDHIAGLGHDDQLFGALGDDVIKGGLGLDLIDGGQQGPLGDTVSYEGETARFHVDLANGTALSDRDPATGLPGAAFALEDTLVSIENARGGEGDDQLLGDAFNNVLEGGAGADTLNGRGGRDTVSYEHSSAGVSVNLATGVNTGGDAQGDQLLSFENVRGSSFHDVLAGNGLANLLDGAGGQDTVLFNYQSSLATLSVSGNDIVVSGPDGTDTLRNIERVEFLDRAIDRVDENVMVDDLFYYAKNPDVWQAKMDPDVHYSQFGWHEGRDPNASFSTSGYLAANPDVAAAGVDPLDHFHVDGWHQGRDPGAGFDAQLYLAHNPDVAEAGMDPLQHYLQFGQAEGRQAYTAIGRAPDIMQGHGFDAEYYLLANPDVARAASASGSDTYAFAQQHYDTFGWHENRNPNSVFDTKGYLTAYEDVAGAGMNPLTHYDTFGWHEGRDPSAGFDTAQYLSHYADVANAPTPLDPMTHYLAFGALEGRSTFADGHFAFG